MADRELTIKSLEIVYRRMKRNFSWFEEAETLNDAISLLKEQEPRVMTADEVQEDELVWIEVPQSDEIWPALLRETDWFGYPKWVMRGFAIARSFLHDGYGRDWRCWTARPTDEQREAVDWLADAAD